MPYSLYFDGVNDYVELASQIDIISTDDFSITINGTPDSAVNYWRPFGGTSTAATNNRCLVFSTGLVRVYFNSGATKEWNTGVDITTIESMEFRRVSGDLDLYINESIQSGGFSSSTDELSIKFLGINGSTASKAFDLLGFDVSINSTLEYSYDPSASLGTGSVLPESVVSNDGTLVNFPTDDSQWLPYGDPADTLDVTELTTTYGDTLNATSSITDATSAKIIDSSTNEIALINFTDLTGGSYTFDLPPLAADLVGVLSGACTIEITNGVDTATDTITLQAPSGYTEVIAATQSGSLELKDWGFTGVDGLDNALTVGDIGWLYDVTGRTNNTNGTSDYDETFTGGVTVTDWYLDLETLVWSEVIPIFGVESGEDTTPDVPDLGADVTDAEPSSYTTRSFVSSGITTRIEWTATGDAELSLNGSSYGATVNAGNGVTIYVRLQADSAFNGVKSGGVAGDSFSVTTRAQTAPVLASTKALGGTIDVASSRTLTIQSGDPATSWTLTGGADQAQYTLSNAGVLTRTVPNTTEEAEVVTVTATNAAGTSNTQTVTITYSEAGEGQTTTSINLSLIRIGL